MRWSKPRDALAKDTALRSSYQRGTSTVRPSKSMASLEWTGSSACASVADSDESTFLIPSRNGGLVHIGLPPVCGVTNRRAEATRSGVPRRTSRGRQVSTSADKIARASRTGSGSVAVVRDHRRKRNRLHMPRIPPTPNMRAGSEERYRAFLAPMRALHAVSSQHGPSNAPSFIEMARTPLPYELASSALRQK